MMPMPPSSATAIAISARVTVSVLAGPRGRFSVRCSERRDERSIVAGSRRSMTLYCGVKRKSSNVQPRTVCRRSITIRSLLPKQRLVVAVVLAEELVDAIELGQQREGTRDEPRSREHIRILDDRLVLECA